MVWLLGSDSILAVYMDPLGSELLSFFGKNEELEGLEVSYLQV